MKFKVKVKPKSKTKNAKRNAEALEKMLNIYSIDGALSNEIYKAITDYLLSGIGWRR